MGKRNSQVVRLAAREASLKRKLRRHLRTLGFRKTRGGLLRVDGTSKDAVRSLHAVQKEARLRANKKFFAAKAATLIKYFAAGHDVNPAKISPVLESVSSDTFEGDLFRFASLTWSVPVSNGFGRRMRYLVWDEHNDKLIGLLAIGDPVFNLSVRDKLIGWDVAARSDRLVNVMDAYVLGAVPPYNSLLCGKLVACLVRSREIYDDFSQKYGNLTGVISQQEKHARLLAVTTSSSLGRSSVYNRLKLGDIQYMRSIGYTGGWGHFHIPDNLFLELRAYLRDAGHPYADKHQYGQGPNWRLRTMRAALESLGFRDDMLRHGIKREVFISLLASNATRILKTGKGRPNLSSLLTAHEIGEQAIERWVLPRSIRRPEYRSWKCGDLVDLYGKQEPLVRSQIAGSG